MNNLYTTLSLISLLSSFSFTYGFGSMGPISAAFGQNDFFCAIDASGKQEVICWGKNTSSSSSTSLMFAIYVPPMAALSGGYGFMCGILVNTWYASCWDSMGFASDLVPQVYQSSSYSYISSGRDHVCAIRGSYYSDSDSGSVDCWDIVETSNSRFSSKQSALYYNQEISSLSFKKIVSGEGFSCGSLKDGGIKCWGPTASKLRLITLRNRVLCTIIKKSARFLSEMVESVCQTEQHSSSNPTPESSIKEDSDPFGLDALIPNASKRDEKVKAKLDAEATASKIRKEEDEEAKRFLKSEREALILCLEIAAQRYKIPWFQTVIDITVKHAFDNVSHFTCKQRNAIEKLWGSIREQQTRRKQGKSVSGKLEEC